ncbi:conserved oligomeric Golgi complex subunit 8-like [Sycon ciliatum]|uniref:conserved oligomeric Golgi complex subunit 8-like n=1 Tax=Sycon ciliatum TaxID=27933 RepID=UPI0031F63B97
MDANEILSVVFGSLMPERWKGNEDAASYVDKLTSLGVDKLAREPERLQEEKAHILSETRDLAFHNYKTFIETAECSKEVFQDFQSVERHLDGLLGRLPTFGDACKTLGDAAKDINARRRINSLTLARHTQLLEILEIPQLMDTCVRNSYYEEALELSAYVRQLKQKFSSISIVADIVSEVDSCSRLMLQQLLQQLRGAIQLPACLKIIGYLRRLDVFSEIELRLKFLQARDSWFQSQVNSVPVENAYQHITKIIELCRVYIFDVITQYRAIFSDDSELLLRPTSSGSTQQNASGIFHSWLVTKVSWFLAVLGADLKAGVGSRLDSLLGQCMYFGLSLGRIGTDFRSLLPPLFQEAALTAFRQNTDAAMSAFRSALSHYTLASSVLLHAHSNLLSSALAASSSTGVSVGLAPNQLLEFPPLASLSNGLTTAFNELRPCAPLAIAPDVVDCLEHCLSSVATSLQAYHQTESSSITDSEAEVFSRLCTSYVHTLVPLVQATVERLFPKESLLHATGNVMSASTLDSELIRAMTLDVAAISAPLSCHIRLPDAPVVPDSTGSTSSLLLAPEETSTPHGATKPDSDHATGTSTGNLVTIDPESHSAPPAGEQNAEQVQEQGDQEPESDPPAIDTTSTAATTTAAAAQTPPAQSTAASSQ